MIQSFISLLSQFTPFAPLGAFLVAAFAAVYGIYQYKDASRPRLVAYTENTDIEEQSADGKIVTTPAVVIVITNIGKLPATDIKITIDPPFSSGMTQYSRRAPLAVLMPQAKQDLYREFYTDVAFAFAELTLEYRITFEYKKPGRRWHYLPETQVVVMRDALSDSSIRNETGGVSPSLVEERKADVFLHYIPRRYKKSPRSGLPEQGRN